MTIAEVLNALRKVERPLFTPGEKYQYSNSSYLLLGLIVEKLSGRPLPVYLQEHVFDPLGMKSTFTLTGGRQKTSDVARGYDDFGSLNDTGGYLGGEGGLYSTVDDLLVFDRALYTEKLVTRSKLNQAFTPGPVRTGETTYGLGWNITKGADGRHVWHTGNTAGLRAFMERRIDAKTTVILLTNRGKPKHPAVIDFIEKRPYVGIQNPVHLPALDSDRERVQRIVLSTPQPEPIRKPQKILFIDCTQHHDDGVLHNPVLYRGNRRRSRAGRTDASC